MQQNLSKQNFLEKAIHPELATFLAIGWNIILTIASLGAAVSVLGQDNFFNLGRPIQIFVAFLLLIPALLGLYSSYHLALRHSQGRIAAVALNYVGMVLSGVYLIHVWGFFTGMDSMAGALYDRRVWLWGFVLAYVIYWIGGRLKEDSPTQILLDRVAMGVGGLSLMALLFTGGIMGAIGDVFGTYGSARAWIVTLVMLVFGLMFYRVLLLGAYFGETPEQRIAWQGWLFLSPNIIGFTIFFAGPLLFSLYLSFTFSPPKATPKFEYFDNYRELLSLEFKSQATTQKVKPMVGVFELEFPSDNTIEVSPQRALSPGYAEIISFKIGDAKRLVVGAKDEQFWYAMKNTLLFSLLIIPTSVIPALLIAIILNSKLPGVKFFRAMYFLPSVAAVVGVGVIWREALYSSSVGYLNYVVTTIVDFINGTFGTSIADPRVVWLAEAELIAVVIMASWQIIGFNTVLYLAGLQGIPRDLYEASEVDGAGKVGQFWYITLPLLGPTTFFVIITTMINGLQVFNEPYVLFRDPPTDPEHQLTAVWHLYRTTFLGSDYGYAASVAWMISAVIFVITLIQFRVQRANPYS